MTSFKTLLRFIIDFGVRPTQVSTLFVPPISGIVSFIFWGVIASERIWYAWYVYAMYVVCIWHVYGLDMVYILYVYGMYGVYMVCIWCVYVH